MKKNILIVTDYAAVYEGNFIRSLKALERSVNVDGYKIFFVFSKKAKKLPWIDTLKNVVFFEDSAFDNIKILKRQIREHNIGVVYTHFCLPKTQIVVKLVKILSPGVKLFSHFHNHYNCEKLNAKEILIKWAFDGDKNIGCSKSVMQSLPFKAKKNCFVNNGIDFSRFGKVRYPRVFEKGKFNVLMFGYLPNRKGVDVAIEAINFLNKKDINLYICMSKDLEKLVNFIVSKFGSIPDFVKFLNPVEEIEQFYQSASVFISPSREEGFCYSVIESAFCKLPVISSDISGVPHDIPQMLFFKMNDYKELADCIEKVYSKEHDLDCKFVMDYVLSHYGVEEWSNKVKGLMYEYI